LLLKTLGHYIWALHLSKSISVLGFAQKACYDHSLQYELVVWTKHYYYCLCSFFTSSKQDKAMYSRPQMRAMAHETAPAKLRWEGDHDTVSSKKFSTVLLIISTFLLCKKTSHQWMQSHLCVKEAVRWSCMDWNLP
jgi:hypothetical protein